MLSPSPPSSPPRYQVFGSDGSHSDDIPGSISGSKSLKLANNHQISASNDHHAMSCSSSSATTANFHESAKFSSDPTSQQYEFLSYITGEPIRLTLANQNCIYISKDDIPVQQSFLNRMKIFMKAKLVIANPDDGYFCIYGPSLEQSNKARRTFIERSHVDTRFVFSGLSVQFRMSLYQGKKLLRSHPFSYKDDPEADANSYFLDK